MRINPRCQQRVIGTTMPLYDAVDGRHPSFPAAHVRLLARLQHDDITGVADYLSRIAPRNARQLATQRSTP
jgi:hypothetical protein